MADLATPSAATMSTIDAGADKPQKPTKAKPEKPDESLYKESLAQAEKAYSVAQEKFVRHPPYFHPHQLTKHCTSANFEALERTQIED